MSRKSESARKGKLVEAIASKLYRTEGVRVRTRVMMPPARGKGARKREVDIVVEPLEGVPGPTFVIECKNEKRPIEAPAIDAFVGKLIYLGIDCSQALFVSRSRFTMGAIERAEDEGIRLYQVSGIRDDG